MTPHDSRLSAAQLDRAIGVLYGLAAGDALGAPYAFHPPRPAEQPLDMVGGGTFGWEPGEWTDDTAMSLVIADVAASGLALTDESALARIGANWYAWAQKAPDVGAQTRAVLTAATHSARDEMTAVGSRHLRAAAAHFHASTGRSGGNGSLMRTAPVALAYLDDEDALFEAALTISGLTHFDKDAGEACALWCTAIRHAVLTGSLNIRRGLARLANDRRELWLERIQQAEAELPTAFENNGWVVHAFQAAWSAITHTPIPSDAAGSHRADHFAKALETAARCGSDTDTVAAVAGTLLGAAHGGSAVPACWRRVLHGWPGMRLRDLARLAVIITRAGDTSPTSWPNVPVLVHEIDPDAAHVIRTCVDPDVLLGGVGVLEDLPVGVDAVVSLCRLGRDEVPARRVEAEDHVEMWLVDDGARNSNPNLQFVLDDAAAVIAQLRDEGKKVFVHSATADAFVDDVISRYTASYTARMLSQVPTAARS